MNNGGMRVGFDYWHVLSDYPEQFKPLIAALERNNDEVCVISAVGDRRAGTVEPAVRELGLQLPVHELKFEDPSGSPALKLAECRRLGIDMFFDDRDDVCRLLSQHGIVAVRVTRPDVRTDVEAEISGR
jgi:hypothetical protein